MSSICRVLMLVLLLASISLGQTEPLARLGTADRRSGFVDSLRFSADGKTLRTISGLPPVLAEWDAESGGLLRATAFAWSGGAGAQSPDLSLFCGRGKGLGDVRVVERVTGKVLAERAFPGVAVPAREAFSADGKRVLIVGRIEPTPGEIRRDLVYVAIWDFAADRVVRIEGRPDGLAQARFSPDGKHVVTAIWIGFGPESEIGVWEAGTGKKVWSMTRAGYLFGSPTFSPDGQRLVLPIAQREPSRAGLDIHDTATARHLAGWDTGREAGLSGAVTFSPDGRHLFAALEPQARREAVVVALDPATGRERYRLDAVRSPIAFAADGKSVVTAGPLQRWDIETGKPAWPTGPLAGTEPARALALSPDGKSVAIVTDDRNRSLVLWDVASRQSRGLGERFAGPLRFSPDGKTLYVTLIAGYGNGGLIGIDTTTGKTVAKFSCAGVFMPTWDQTIQRLEFGEGDRLRAWMSLSEDALTQGSGWIEWDRTTGKVLASKQAEPPDEGPYAAGILGVAATPDRMIQVRVFVDRLEVYDRKAKRIIKTIAPPQREGPWSGHVDVNADGTIAATAHSFGSILIWDLRP